MIFQQKIYIISLYEGTTIEIYGLRVVGEFFQEIELVGERCGGGILKKKATGGGNIEIGFFL